MTDQQKFLNEALIWSPQQLNERLGEDSLVVVDVRATHQVMTGIIPGAAHLDLFGIGLSHASENLLDELVNLMRSLLGLRGVGPEKTVVFVEEDTGMRVARGFWLLEYMGHKDVHVLDGGMRAWRDAGLAITQVMEPPKASRFPITPQPEIYISADELGGMLGQPDLVVLDTRSQKEWSGENKRGAARGGTIPGAVHLEWSDCLEENGQLKSPVALATIFERLGVTRDKAIVPF